jgi:hypothetical protein
MAGVIGYGYGYRLWLSAMAIGYGYRRWLAMAEFGYMAGWLWLAEAGWLWLADAGWLAGYS